MNTALRAVFTLFLSSLVSLSSFGLFLALLWLLNGNEKFYKVITSLISASFSTILGGFVLAWMTKQNNHALPAFLGLMIGFVSSLYLFGIRLLVVPLTMIAVALAVVGSYLYQVLIQRNPRININLG